MMLIMLSSLKRGEGCSVFTLKKVKGHKKENFKSFLLRLYHILASSSSDLNLDKTSIILHLILRKLDL